MVMQLKGDGTIVGMAAGQITPTNLTQPLTLGTAKATTSGTSIDFSSTDGTAVPAWVKRITLLFNNISLSSSASYGLVRLGAGSVDSASYNSTLCTSQQATSPVVITFSDGIYIFNPTTAADTFSGTLVLNHIGGNIWVWNGQVNVPAAGSRVCGSAGSKALSGALDRIRLTTSNGTDTFDAGSVNILYE